MDKACGINQVEDANGISQYDDAGDVSQVDDADESKPSKWMMQVE